MGGNGRAERSLTGRPGAIAQASCRGAGGGALGVRSSEGWLVDGGGPGGQPKEPLPPPQPQASARAPRPLGDVLPWVRGLL